MRNAIPANLVSHYRHLQALLVLTAIVVVGLSGTVVLLATGGDEDIVTRSAPASAVVAPTDGVRYDGGPEEGTRGPLSHSSTAAPSAGVRYDGGPEEGTRGALSHSATAGAAAGAR